ncbi:MIP/aquaporin family protein [Kineococcus gypseus]|uniref:MIP/aquaporin family protein n=1 Tax=Kineococcus gypseus TaxID=1637102 RepID=UPI003D7CFEBB
MSAGTEGAVRVERAPSRGGNRGLYGSDAGANTLLSGTAEAVGTFVLVLAGTATAAAGVVAQPVPYDLLAVVLAFGLALAALAAALGHVSGCHLNPAVTLGLAVTRRFPWRAVPVYVACQLAGAVMASLAVWAFYGERAREAFGLAATVPAPGVGDARALLVEAVITFVLVLVVISVATDERAPAAAAPLAVGATLAVCVAVAAPLTGGAVNPARAFGPALVSGTWDSFWVYLVGPLVGGVLAALLYDRVLGRAEAPSGD